MSAPTIDVNRGEILDEIPNPAEELARRSESQTRLLEGTEGDTNESEEEETEDELTDIVHDENGSEPASKDEE